MAERKLDPRFKFIKWALPAFYRGYEFLGTEHMPSEPCVYVGNHTQANGPLMSELYFPGKHVIWCAGQMMNRDEVADYAFTDFWSFKPKWTHPFWRLVSHMIVPLSLLLFNNAATLPVYHDTRIITTFRSSIAHLQEGESLIIFPEKNEKFNNIVYEFQDKFIDLARFYHKKTGKALQFVPMYICPALRKVVFGPPIAFDSAAKIDDERARICAALKQGITELALALPEHTVVPYRNIPKKLYPKNRPLEVYKHESL